MGFWTIYFGIEGGGTAAAPVTDIVTVRLGLLGTSQERLNVFGISAERVNLLGSST